MYPVRAHFQRCPTAPGSKQYGKVAKGNEGEEEAQNDVNATMMVRFCAMCQQCTTGMYIHKIVVELILYFTLLIRSTSQTTHIMSGIEKKHNESRVHKHRMENGIYNYLYIYFHSLTNPSHTPLPVKTVQKRETCGPTNDIL